MIGDNIPVPPAQAPIFPQANQSCPTCGRSYPQYAMEDTKQKYDIGLPRGGEGGAGGSSADALARIEAAMNAIPPAARPVAAPAPVAPVASQMPTGRALHMMAVAENVGNPQGLRAYATKAGLSDSQVKQLIYETYDHNPTAAKVYANFAATGQ